jgi:hypothetical protein
LRQSRSYGALNETHRQIDEQQNSQPETPTRTTSRDPRNYGALHETHRQADEAPEPERPGPLRSWTHRGGMVPHQESAHTWIRQNNEIRMAESDKSGPAREGEAAQPSQPNRDQNQAELQEARAAVEEARRREAAERARLQERERGGPER